MSYATFKSGWLGRRVDYDHVYAFQCVDLVVQYLYQEFGITGAYGNAIDYWRRPSLSVTNKFDKVSSTDCRQGDIVILNGLAGNPYGHIGICDSQTGDTVSILEQNGSSGNGDGLGGNAIRVRAVSKSRIAGLLRPKAVAPPVVTPVPARSTVTLPASVQSWAIYRLGSGLRKGTSDQIGTLAPAKFGGLTYKIEGWVGDYAVIIQTQNFGRGTIWVKGTEAIIK